MSATSAPRSRRPSRLALHAFALLIVACGPDRSAPSPSGEPPDTREPASTIPEDDRPAILFLGNSLTAGLGVDPVEAFPARIQTKLDSAGLAYRVINAGVSGETSGGGLRRIDFLLDPSVEVLFLALGGNDALRGVTPDSTRRNLQTIIDRTRTACATCEIVIAGMLAPPNLGPTYTEAFAEIFPRLARENDVRLVPFLLEGVAGVRELNQADGIHPTARGHEILSETVWGALREAAEARAAARRGG